MPVFKGMTKPVLKAACAPLAIAAMAAFHTIPAAAQSQPQIVIDVPDTPTTTSEPTIDLPDPESVVIDPVPSQSAPATTAATAPEPLAAVTTSRSTATAAPESPPVTASSADTVPAIPAITSGEIANPPAAIPAAADSEIATNRAELAPAPAAIEDASGAALFLALLGVGGIALLGFFLMRRRRRAVPTIERPIVTEAHENPRPALQRDPVVTVHDNAPLPVVSAEASPVLARETMTSPAARSDGAAVELPQEVPPTLEGRTKLLKRMVAARPDRANPFKSPKARLKRARLIMQSIGTSFRDRKPRIDLSQYTNIWPELRGWKPAAA